LLAKHETSSRAHDGRSHIAGWDANGFALGAGLIAALDAVKDSYNVDRLAIVAASAAIEDIEHHRKIVDHVISERVGWKTSSPSLASNAAIGGNSSRQAGAPVTPHPVADALRERRIRPSPFTMDAD